MLKHRIAKDYNVDPKHLGIDFDRTGIYWAQVAYTIEKEGVKKANG